LNSDGLYDSGSHYAIGAVRLSHLMSILATNLTSRRVDLKLSVQDVTDALNRRGIDVAYSTVAAWFNGGRRPREMDHLKALCEELKTSISEMAGEDPAFAQNTFEAQLLEEARILAPMQQQAVLALIASMGRGRKS